MNKYELGIVVRADLDDESFQAEMTRVKGLIERFEGTIEKVDEWGRRKLAYPINKLTEGVYTFITFSSPANAPRDIEDRLRIMENVLRFLIIRKDEADVTVSPPVQEKPAEPVAEPAESVAAEAVETTEAVETAEEAPVAEAPEEPASENVDSENVDSENVSSENVNSENANSENVE